ncbi:DNA polymerase I [Saccharobesus litoralis]|uniref:DNA polymerase I n=1 Tax=Saccharobesus litoralis TaxID=2172099 RepID=A0A2S0VQT2_9ALTE|nr:DNA polymerase I [Saccharobesus litoralis]AWB66568.1 DNA polymerase I [Saccharobesus litoralis]
MPAIPENPLVLVDGSSYLFRAYHSPPHLTNSKGEPTGAIYGVINMLNSLINRFQPSHIVVIFDAKGKTFRNDIYADYKANRPPMPDDLRSQIAPLHEVIKAMGLPLISIEGVEADDVIGTLAKQLSEQGQHVLISTGDKDMAQLVNDKVTLINTMTDTILDTQGVIDKFGIPPELIIDYLALMGDKVDNIPGLPGVGEKTALAMLQGIGSIEQLYQDPEKVATLGFRGAKSMPKKLIENKEAAELSYTLATIKLDVELDLPLEKLAKQEADNDQLIKLFGELEFRRWLAEALGKQDGSSTSTKSSQPKLSTGSPATSSKIQGDAEKNTAAIEADYQCIFDKATFNEWLAQLQNVDAFAFDTETTSLNYMDAELVGLSFAIEAGKAAYVPVAHDYPDAPEQLDRDWVLTQLKPLLEDANKAKIGQNLKYDAHILANYDIELAGMEYDSMLESYVFSSVGSRHDMDSLALKYLGHKNISFEEIAGKGAKQLTFNQIPIEQAAPYAAEDADITLRLHQTLFAKLQADNELLNVYQNIEKPLIPVLKQMEHQGVLIDIHQLAQQSQDIAIRLSQLEQQAYEIAGETFNLGSPKQLQGILFDKLNHPILKKTPKGAPSTAEEVLQELAHDFPLPKVIIEHRGLSKLKSTYTDKLPLMVNNRTGRVHTSYHQAVTATGRLSSTDPNLQNIPIRTEDGRKVRHAFVAPEGYKVLAADYSQIELRIMAHLSADKGLVDAFSQGLDIHKATAAEVFDTPFDQVTSDQRRSAKAVNFGLIYGMSAFGLSRQLGIPRGEAQKYMDLYFERYPGVLDYMERTREQAEQNGYVSTLNGRRLHLPEIKARNQARKKAAERAAINAPMQGTAADIIKLAMINMAKALAEQNPNDIRMLMQVHDELVFEVKESFVETASSLIKQTMEQAMSLDVPLVVEVGVGDNWQQAH